MIEIGKVNTLLVSKETKSGHYLSLPEAPDVEVFMPPSMAPIRVKANQEINVFVYLDTQGRMIATSELPFAEVGEYALMQAVEVQDFGAFFDWGIEKGLLVPGNEQKIKVKNHEKHIVRVCLEEGTNRVYGTTKLGKYIEHSDFDIIEKENIKIIPAKETELGYKVIINKKFIGMIYSNELFQNIQIGQSYDAIVKKIRDDGLVDVVMQVQGIKNLDEAQEKILKMLSESGGESDLYDKSSPEDIKKKLLMSKKTFKSAIGMLYKSRHIELLEKGIRLTTPLLPKGSDNGNSHENDN